MTDNSNPKRNPPNLREGIQNRNNSQGELLNSLDCPLYSKPGDKALPYRKIKVIIGKTIIPHKHDNEKCIKYDRYYIWRTKCDNQVRKSCAANESKIFDYENPPKGGNLGEPYNCRFNKICP